MIRALHHEARGPWLRAPGEHRTVNLLGGMSGLTFTLSPVTGIGGDFLTLASHQTVALKLPPTVEGG